MIILKEKIIEKMKEKNLSIAVLEKKAELTIHSIRNILKRRIKSPRAKTLSAIAEALECSLLDLINSSSSFSNSWQENKIMKKKNNCLKHPTLMAERANAVASLLEEKALILSLNDYFIVIRTIYFHFFSKEPRMPDIKFAKWLLEKDYILYGKG